MPDTEDRWTRRGVKESRAVVPVVAQRGGQSAHKRPDYPRPEALMPPRSMRDDYAAALGLVRGLCGIVRGRGHGSFAVLSGSVGAKTPNFKLPVLRSRNPEEPLPKFLPRSAARRRVDSTAEGGQTPKKLQAPNFIPTLIPLSSSTPAPDLRLWPAGRARPGLCGRNHGPRPA